MGIYRKGWRGRSRRSPRRRGNRGRNFATRVTLWLEPLRSRYSSARKSMRRDWASETCDMPCLAAQPLRNRSSGVSCGAGLSFSSRTHVWAGGRGYTGQSWHMLSLSSFPLFVGKGGGTGLLLWGRLRSECRTRPCMLLAWKHMANNTHDLVSPRLV